MFTGLIQGVGKVVRLEHGVLEIEAPQSMVDFVIGESVAVNGCCLTVVREKPHLVFELSPETLARTALMGVQEVNLERAMRPMDRFGGHIVQGHVDGVGELLEIEPKGDHSRFRFRVEHDAYLIDKGSIALDGISLTVVEPKNGEFDVWIIPHTLQHTNLRNRKPGDRIHVEYDVVAKHIEKLAQSARGTAVVD